MSVPTVRCIVQTENNHREINVVTYGEYSQLKRFSKRLSDIYSVNLVNKSCDVYSGIENNNNT